MGFATSVGINEWTGELFCYHAVRRSPLAIDPAPDVNSETAEATALGAFPDLAQIKSVLLLHNAGLWVDRDESDLQRLARVICVVLSETDNYTIDDYARDLENPAATGVWVWDVKIDAHTGEVFYREPGGSLGKRTRPASPRAAGSTRTHRVIRGAAVKEGKARLTLSGRAIATNAGPFVIGGVPSVYVRHLALLGYTVTWRDGVILLRGAKRVELRIGSGTAVVDGSTVALPHRVVALFGRAYVPADTLGTLFGSSVTWHRASGTVDMKPSR